MLEHYFGDMSKYPMLSADEIHTCAVDMSTAFDRLTELLLDMPLAWQYIIDEWQTIRIEGKASNKLSENYGNAATNAKELTNHVDLCLDNAAQLIHQMRMLRWEHAASIVKIKAAFRKANLSRRLYKRTAEHCIGRTSSNNDELGTCLKIIQTNKDKMVTSNLRLVVNFAKKFPSISVSLPDLIQEGNLGLIRAVEKYDPSRNIKFSTYAAWWIRQAFLRAVKTQGKTIRLPTHVYDSLTRLRRLQDEIRMNEDRNPSVEELADLIGVKASTVNRLLSLQNEPVSLSCSVRYRQGNSDPDDKTIGDFVSNETPLFHDEDIRNFMSQGIPDIEKEVDDKKRQAIIKKQLRKCLTPAERQIIQWRHGLGGNEIHTLEQIAERLGRSRERIRQIEAGAIAKLRDNADILKGLQDG